MCISIIQFVYFLQIEHKKRYKLCRKYAVLAQKQALIAPKLANTIAKTPHKI